QLTADNRKLPTAYCLLLTAYSLLLTTYCLSNERQYVAAMMQHGDLRVGAGDLECHCQRLLRRARGFEAQAALRLGVNPARHHDAARAVSNDAPDVHQVRGRHPIANLFLFDHRLDFGEAEVAHFFYLGMLLGNSVRAGSNENHDAAFAHGEFRGIDAL